MKASGLRNSGDISLSSTPPSFHLCLEPRLWAVDCRAGKLALLCSWVHIFATLLVADFDQTSPRPAAAFTVAVTFHLHSFTACLRSDKNVKVSSGRPALGAHHRPVWRLEEPHARGQLGEKGQEAATYQTLFWLLALFKEKSVAKDTMESGQTQKGRCPYFIWATIYKFLPSCSLIFSSLLWYFGAHSLKQPQWFLLYCTSFWLFIFEKWFKCTFKDYLAE